MYYTDTDNDSIIYTSINDVGATVLPELFAAILNECMLHCSTVERILYKKVTGYDNKVINIICLDERVIISDKYIDIYNMHGPNSIPIVRVEIANMTGDTIKNLFRISELRNYFMYKCTYEDSIKFFDVFDTIHLYDPKAKLLPKKAW
jgi:hypothetical protein